MVRRITDEEYHVVITGAAGRLGRQLVTTFAATGVTVSAVVRNEDDAGRIKPAPDLAMPSVFACDLGDPKATRQTFDQIVDRSGAPHAVIHAVGTWGMTPLTDTSLQDWHLIIDTNLTTTFICFRESARVMSERGGALIAFASGQGADRGQANQSAYAAAKAGVIRLVESVDAEFRDAGIRAYAVAPSFILFDEEEVGGEAGVHARELAELCRYLCDDDAGALSGNVIRAYGTRQ